MQGRIKIFGCRRLDTVVSLLYPTPGIQHIACANYYGVFSIYEILSSLLHIPCNLVAFARRWVAPIWNDKVKMRSVWTEWFSRSSPWRGDMGHLLRQNLIKTSVFHAKYIQDGSRFFSIIQIQCQHGNGIFVADQRSQSAYGVECNLVVRQVAVAECQLLASCSTSTRCGRTPSLATLCWMTAP